MGYGPSRHAFVYPGLLEMKNLERFFMQMYFKVELFKEEGAGLIVHRHYILKNMKEDQQPDIMEVIVGDHSIGDLYSRVLEGDALQKEIVNELTAYIACLETCLSKGDDLSAGQLVNTLLTLYADYYLVYIQLAEALWKHGQVEPAGQILAACLGRCKMSTATRDKIHSLIERLSPINT